MRYVKAACTDLHGGCWVTGIPTVTGISVPVGSSVPGRTDSESGVASQQGVIAWSQDLGHPRSGAAEPVCDCIRSRPIGGGDLWGPFGDLAGVGDIRGIAALRDVGCHRGGSAL